MTPAQRPASNGVVTWPRLATVLVFLSGLLLSASAFMVTQKGPSPLCYTKPEMQQFEKRIDAFIQRQNTEHAIIQQDLKDIQKELKR